VKRGRRGGERGQATVLIIGFTVVAVMMVAMVVDASAAYLRRTALDSLADGAALAAADGIQGRQVYEGGLGHRAEIDPVVARRVVAEQRRGPSLPRARLHGGHRSRPGGGPGLRAGAAADHPARLGSPAGCLRNRGLLRRREQLNLGKEGSPTM
jgi:hypothetical protein